MRPFLPEDAAVDAAHETTPLLGQQAGQPAVPWTSVRRVSGAAGQQNKAVRRNSMRNTAKLVPAMGTFGSFLFLSNLITG